MPVNDPNDLDRVDHEIRLNELKAEAEDLAGGDVLAWEADECPPDIAEEFWKHVVAFEKAPHTSTFQQLLDRGVELPAPVDLTDEELHAKLWEVIGALADMNVYLLSTDHLGDRELYAQLWSDVLHEWAVESPFPGAVSHLDLVSSGSEEDIALWMRYYADDETRAQWQHDFPGEKLPPRQKPPHDRDRHLPKPPRE